MVGRGRDDRWYVPTTRTEFFSIVWTVICVYQIFFSRGYDILVVIITVSS
jgi:hypothetical protein